MPIFKYNNQKYSVADEHIDSFSTKYPDATTIIEDEGKKYKVKSSDYNTFVSRHHKTNNLDFSSPSVSVEPAQVIDSIQPADPVAQVKQDSQDIDIDEWMKSLNEFTPSQKTKQETSVEKIIDNTEDKNNNEVKKSIDKKTNDLLKEDLSLGTFNHTKDNGLQFNPSTGKLEHTYSTPFGTTTTDKRLADIESYQYRAASDMTVSGQIRQANIRLEQLKNKAEQRRQQIIQGWEDKYQEEYKKAKDEGKALIWHLGNTLGQDQHSYITRTNEELLTDQEYRAYQAAIRQTEEQIATLEREGDRQSGKRVGFWRGFGEITGDLRTWDFGMQDILDATAMSNSGKEYGSESVNRANQELLEATFKNQQAQQSYGQNDNFWYRAGTMTGHMPAFMVDFAITGGGFEGINVLAKTATKGATKVIGKEVIEEMAKQGFKSYVKANGVKGFGQYAGNWTIKALGTMTDDLIIRAPLMTNTVQGAKTTADIIDRKLGSVIVNEDGTYDFSNDKTWSSAIWQGEANSIIENYSEMFGAHLAPVTFKNMSDVAAVFGAKRLSGVLAKADAGAIGAIMGKTNEMFTKLGVSDYFGEVTEEYYGQLWRTMLNLDDAYRQNSDGTRTNLLLTGQFHGDILGGMALSMGMMGAGKYSLTAANYAFMKHDVNKADSRARELFGTDTWESLRQTIDLTTNDNIGGYIDNIVADTELTDIEKGTILNYIERSLYLRGFNLATLAQSRNAEETDENVISQQNNESYMDGYNATAPQEMNDVNNNYLYHREMMAQMFGIDESDIESFLGEDPIATAVRMRQNGASNEEVQTVVDFLNAKATYDGMLQSVRDDIDGQIEQSNARIDSYINKGTGMVHGAVLKEGEQLVYIVNGNAVAFEDGVIDNQNSSQTIIVKDAATGELRQISPTDIASLYDVQDPNEQKEMNAQRIRDGVADEALNKINGVVDFGANMVNQIGNTIGITMVLTERGFDKEYIKTFLANAQIVENPDGTLTFTDGQNNVVVPKQEIQQKTDAANMERVAAINEHIDEVRKNINNPSSTEEKDVSLQTQEQQDEVSQRISQNNNGTQASQNGRMEEAAIRLRSSSETFLRDSGKSQPELSESEVKEAESYAKENGLWIPFDDVFNLGNPGKGGNENETYFSPEGNVYKVNNLMNSGDIASLLERLLLHNQIFPETAYELVGFTGFEGRSVYPIVRQRAINNPTEAIPEEIEAYMTSLGFTKISETEYANNEVIVSDLHPRNVLKDSDGDIYVVDAEFKRTKSSLIPKDEQGNPIYEQADPATAWDALMEEAEGDEEIAMSVAQSMIADKEKELSRLEKTKVKEGSTVAEKTAAHKAHKAAIEQARQNVDAWRSIAGIPAMRQQVELAELQRIEDERAAQQKAEEERLKSEREEAARLENERLNGIPDYTEDTPQNARTRGYRRVNGHFEQRQQPLQAVQGKETEVEFSNEVRPKGRYAVIDASQLQPSHIQGNRNPMHFLDEAQPKERNDNASIMSAQKIAGNIRPATITTGETAYVGTPTVNARGEVIQGNSRSDALKLMYGNHKDQGQIYKQYLIDNAEQFGLNPEDIANMENPVLVRMLDVSDEQAITLGQYVAQDTESGGVERIKPKNAVKKMGGDMRTFANILLDSADEDLSFAELLDSNGVKVLKWMNQKGYITDTQYSSAFDSKGNLTGDIKNDLRGIMYQSIFQGGNTRLEEMFNALPAKAQKAILATAHRDFNSPNSERMIEEIQNSIRAFYALMQDEQFAKAKNFKDATMAVEAWKKQYQMDDVTGESYLPSEKFTNFALHLAKMYKGEKQSNIQSTFEELYDLIQGAKEDNLFEQADKTPRTLVQAIKETLNIDYNGQRRNNVLVGDNKTSQQGQHGRTEDVASRERTENGYEQNDNSGRTEGDSGQLRNDEERKDTLSEVIEISSAERTEMETRIVDWLSEDNLSRAVGKTREEIFDEFGNELMPIAYIPTQFISLVSPTLKDQRIYCGKGYFIDHALRNHTGAGAQVSIDEVDVSKYLNIQTVLDNPDHIKETYVDGKRTVVFIKKIGRFFAELTQVEENGKVVLHKSFFNQKKEPYAKLNDIRQEDTSSEGGTSSISHTAEAAPAISLQSRGDVMSNDDNSSISDSKDTTNSPKVKGLEEENSQSLGEQIKSAEKEVNTSPTDKQKEAGNYKKGHVQIGTFNITIEQPKGSVRSGVDANGRKWETTMHNTYGYIRGTEGVDGDHIDVFLSDDIDGWNGSKVFVVDQYNEDGTFDEHKVMLGFNTIEDAESAYLANYEKGWEKKHKIEVSPIHTEEFEKWIDSSHRKTKAFAEYKSVKTTEGQSASVEDEAKTKDFDFDAIEELNDAPYTVRSGINTYATLAYYNAVVKMPKNFFAAREEDIPRMTYDRFEAEFKAVAPHIFKRAQSYLPVVYEYMAARVDKLHEEHINSLNKKQQETTTPYSITHAQEHSNNDILESVTEEIADIINDSKVEGVNVKEIWINENSTDSQLDAVLFYEGNVSEDDLSNLINEYGLIIEGTRINTIPIQVNSQDDIDRYKNTSNQSDGEKVSDKQKSESKQDSKSEKTDSKTIVEQSKKPSSKIEDFGEKIGGARKDVIRKYADKINVNGTTFGTMFPKPDIDKLIEAGLPVNKVAAVKAMFDNAKREFESKKKHYGKDKALQNAAFYAMYAQNVLTGNENNFDLSFNGFVFTEWGKAFMKANIALYQSVFDRLGVEYGKMDLSSYGIKPITEENRKNYNLKHLNEQNRKSQEEFAKQKGTKPPIYKDGDLINFVGSQHYNPKDQFETLEEAIDTMVERIKNEVKVGEESKHKAEIYWKKDALGRTDYSKIFVGVKVHGHGTVDLMEFKSSKEAYNWVEEHETDFQQMASAKTEQLKSDKSKLLPKYRIDHRFVRNDNGSIVRYEVFADFGKGITHTLKTFEIPAKENSQDRLRAQGEVYKNEVLPYMNSDDAKQSADEHARRIQREKESKNKNYTTERKSRERVGKDWRNGKDATPDMFVDMDGKKSVFGFRAVEFGNYVTNKERQQFLNDIYDALMDMSDVLGVSPRALSLGGQLAIAVGARGKSSASGHYEPEKNVINLTKTSGYGVLAHEWLHAFDRYFSNYDPSAIYVGGVRYATGTEYKDDTRQEVKDAFAALMDVMKKSDYYKRSMMLGEYWASDKELAARALQDHIIRKLNERGQKNDFLSNLTATEDWDGNANDYPFPIGEESERIGEAIDNLFSVIDEKVDEKGNTIMYQKGELVMNAESEAFRHATERTMKQLESIGIDVEIVEDGTIVEKFENRAIRPNFSRSAGIFYSNAKKAVLDIKQDKATPEQWIAMLKKNGGLKSGEDAWVGLEEWLNKQEGSVTKQEIIDYIDENSIQIEEVEYEESPNSFDELKDEYERLLREEGYDYAQEVMRDRYGDDFDIAFDDIGGELVIDNEEAAATLLGSNNIINSTRLQYTTEGLDNKKEIALVVPTIESYNSHDAVHFGDAGGGRAVAWIRFGETTDKDGKRVLVIDEIQSKRHQDGREKGYRNDKVLTARLDALKESAAKVGMTFNADVRGRSLQFLDMEGNPIGTITRKPTDEQSEIMAQVRNVLFTNDGVPSAPFEKNWQELAMKRMLRYAAENGFDKVAWTTGEQQAERYSLSKAVKKTTVSVMSDNTRMVTLDFRHDEGYMDFKQMRVDEKGTIIGGDFTGSQLSDIVGKEFAIKIMGVEAERETFTDNDLRIGGEGMKGFYDKILPSFVSKYTKKWGGKVEETELPETGLSMHSVDVTPQMKEDVMKGQPMFMRTSSGTIYGWTVNGRIYLTKDGINPNTPVHEYAHLWAESMANSNPKRWRRIVEGLKGSPVWNEVLLDSEYKDIHGNDILMASEVLSRLSGNENYKRTMEEAQREIESEKDIFAKAEKVTVWERLKQALKDFWNWVGLRFTRRPISPEQSADMVLADFWNGIRPEAENGPMQRMFVGEKGAANIDKAKEATSRLDNLSVARNMETEGKDAKNIKLATGWERGSDGKWRYEVMDDFRFDRSGNVDFEKRNPEYRRYKELIRKNNALAFEGKKLSAEEKSELDKLSAVWKGEKLHNSRRLKDYIDAPELFEAYPELKGVDIRFEVLEDGVQGKYNHKQNTITLNAMLGKEDAASTLNHEIQHAIQHIEGFAKGGSSNDVITRKQEFKSEVRKLHEMMLETPEWAEYVRLVDRWIDNEDASVEARIDRISASGVLDGIRSEQDRLRRKYGNNTIVGRILNGPYAEDADIWNELPESFNDRFDAYRRLAGEVESRNVQRRMEMSTEERHSSLAQETEDVARKDQVFLYDALENAEGNTFVESVPFVNAEDVESDWDIRFSMPDNKYTEKQKKYYVEKISGGLWIDNKQEFAKFVSAVENYVFEENGEGIAYTDNHFYAYYWNVNGEPMPYVDVYLNAEESQDIVNQINQEIKNDGKEPRVKQYINTAIGWAWTKQSSDNGNNGNNNSMPSSAEDDKLDSNILRKGRYFDNPSLYVKTQRADRYNRDRVNTVSSSPAPVQRRQMVEHAENLAKRLHLDNIEIVNSVSGLEGKKKSAKGFYDPKTGKITIVIPNNTSIADIEKTLLHEAVAHYGLRQLFGEHFDTFLDNVYNNADESIRKRIAELAIRKYNYDFRKASEEYLASLAESTNFENAQQSSWWQKVKDFFADMLSKLGFKDFRGVTLTDNELRYVLWRSYENLKEKKNDNIFSLASDIAKQHELGVGNYAKSSQSDDDILFRDDYEKTMARYRYEARLKSGWFQTQEALQDSMLGLKEAMSAILDNDINIEDVDGFENAYLGENRLSSVNKAEADAFANTLFKPMLDEVAKLAHNKTEKETLTDYMMAKHGLERNEYMRQQAMQNGGDASRDFAGLTALTGFNDVMLAEAEAKRMVEEYEQDHNTDELWDKVNAVSRAILQKSYECGLMSKETFDDVSSMYQYYIPLRGFDEKTSAETYAYLNHNSSAFNAPIRKAEGRASKADDPFANLQSMAESTIMQGNRNRLVKQRFLNFVLNHPSDLVSVSELWIEHDAISDEWKPVFPDNLNDNDTPEEIEQKFKDFEDKMRSLAQQYPDQYKHGRDTIGIPYRIVGSRDLSQHQVIVKRGGKDIILTVNGNPRLAQALNGQTNPDNDMSGAIGAILRSGEWVNRQLSAFYTTRNPDFIVSNFVRDMFYTNTMAWIKESPNYALRFNRNYIMVNPVTMKRLLGKYRKGTLDLSDKTELMFYQFMVNGGETGYVNIRDIEQHKNGIRKELKRTNGRIKIGRALSLLAERFDELNRAVENCARFAAFVTSREMGRTLDRSIYDAKEISVNFNKKGSGAKFYGSVGQTFSGNASALVSGLGRSGYVFWNAAIQGTTNFGRQVKRHPAKAFTGIAAMFLLGVLVAYLGGDDDEDKNAYYNLPEHVRRSNILFRTGDSWISIPLPIEYRAIYGMGELMTSVLSGKEHLTDEEVAEAIAGQVSQLLPIDFLEGGGGINAFAPSAVKPLWEAYVAEKSWTGMPIYKDTPYNKNMPEWTKAYKSTNKHIVNLAATLNEATGGDRYTKGAVDINPAKIEYMLNGYFSGVWGTINKLSKTAETIAGEREYDPSNILLMNRLVKAGDERTEYRAVNNEYFRLKEEHDQLKTRLRKYENDTYNGVFDYAEKIDFLYNSPEYQRYEIFELYNKEINDINDILKETYNNEERKYLESELNELKKEMIQEIDKTRQTRKGA